MIQEQGGHGDESMVHDNETQTRNDPHQDKLQSWLPITASRKAKWWYSTFHNVTAMVGAGVLGLPFAISQLGWYLSICLSVCPYT